jgi:hypothetical protein
MLFYFGQSITPNLVNYDGNYSYAAAQKGEYRQQTTDVGTFPLTLLVYMICTVMYGSGAKMTGKKII